MWLLTTLMASSFALSPVNSADHELDLEIRSTQTADPSFDHFNDADGFGTWGLRGGYGLSPHVKIIGSYAHGGRGLGYNLPGGETFRTQYKMETIGLGARGGWLYRGIVGPMATVQGLGMFGTARFDERQERDDNAGQYTRRGFGVGLTATAGAEVRVPTYTWVEPAFSLEFGYMAGSAIRLGETGTLAFNGFTARGTIGLRFR